MRGVWAMARQTVAQALRMRMAVVFILLLAVFLAAVFGVEGDRTLAGRLRTFLQYSLLATQVLLTVVTVLVGVNAVAGDLRGKQVFFISSKPLPRWQYVLGRWLGVVLLDAMLLAIALCVIYAGAQYLRAQDAQSADDRVTVETQVFAARERARPEPPPGLTDAVDRQMRDLAARDALGSALEPLLAEAGGDRDAAMNALRQKLAKEEIQRRETVNPGRPGLTRRFTGIHLAGAGARATGHVRAVATWQVAGPDGPIPVTRLVIEADAAFLGRLLAGGPMRVADVPARVGRRGPEQFEVYMQGSDAQHPEVTALEEGDTVALAVSPLVQLRYRVDIAEVGAPGADAPRPDVLKSQWWMQTPDGDYGYPPGRPVRDDPIRTAKTMVVPARVVNDAGATEVHYINRNHPPYTNVPVQVRVPREEMYLLYRRGGFGGNFLRTAALSLAQLTFLAALSVWAGTFLSFPVGALVCFAALPFAFLGSFLADATKLPTHPGSERGVGTIIGHYVLAAFRWLLPDLAGRSAGAYLVDGRYFGWGALGGALLATGLLRTAVVLALACLIFRKRELARVQV